jgi:hypothetical protein
MTTIIFIIKSEQMDFIIVKCQLLREELNHYYRSNQILSVISFEFTIKIKTRANFVSM